MALNAIMDTLEGLSEDVAALYTQKGDKFELTGIAGVKTQADIDRIQTSLHKSQQDYKEVRDKFKAWGDMDFDETMAKLDRLPELEAAAAGSLDEAKVEEIVTKRVEGVIASKTAPLERQITALTEERDTFANENGELKAGNQKRTIHDNVRKAMISSKVIPEAHEDALMHAERVFQIREDDGAIVTKDGVGVTPGIPADIWLQEMQNKRPHWWPGSGGGGAGGGDRPGGNFSNNPFSAEHWNLTKQGQILSTEGREKAEQMAKSAGTTVGGQRPAPKK